MADHKHVAPLWLAAHETAHGVSRLVLNDLTPHERPALHSVSLRCNRGSLGQTSMQARAAIGMDAAADLSPDLLNQALIGARYEAIEALVGPVAEIRQRTRAYAGYMSTAQVVDTVLQMDRISAEDDDDFGAVRRILGRLEAPYPRAELRQLWLAACNLVHIEWPGIRLVAQELRRQEEMNGEDFETLWRAVRPNGQTRRRRAAACVTLPLNGVWHELSRAVLGQTVVAEDAKLRE